MRVIPAHLGHLGDLAGHDHWAAGAAIGAAIAVGVWGWLTKGDDAEGEADAAPESEEQAS